MLTGADLQEFSNLDDAVVELVGFLSSNDSAELAFDCKGSTTLESIEKTLAAQGVRHDATLVRKRVGDELVLSLERSVSHWCNPPQYCRRNHTEWNLDRKLRELRNIKASYFIPIECGVVSRIVI